MNPLWIAGLLVAGWLIARNLIEKTREEQAGGYGDVIDKGAGAVERIVKFFKKGD
jgi:hypothetical protein